MARNSDLSALNRQWELLKLLPAKPPGKTCRELLESLEALGYPVAKRTVERDLQDLSLSFPIQCNDKGRPYGWYWTPGQSAELPGISLAEALSINLVEELLKPLIPQAILTGLKAHFNQAQNKLAALHEDNAIARWQDKVRHVPPTLVMLPPTIDDTVLDSVQQALLKDRQIEVEYQAIHHEQFKKQTLHPLGLVQRGPITYLVATAFAYPDIRLYAVHRFSIVILTEKTVQRPENFNLDAYIAGGALQFGNGKTLQLTAWVSEWLAHYLSETRLSEDQALIKEEDGYLLTATVQDTWQLQWWILSYSQDIIVLEPKTLRDEILSRLNETLAGYENTVPQASLRTLQNSFK
jgi:predicted DNA-binding transcriptional regulator YafY